MPARKKILTYNHYKPKGPVEAWTLRVPTNDGQLAYLHPMPCGYTVELKLKGAALWESQEKAERANASLLEGMAIIEKVDMSQLEDIKRPVYEPLALVQKVPTRRSCGRK